MPKANEMKRMRTLGVLVCGAALAVLPALAQQDAAPPPPPQGDMQGPPPGGHGGPGGRGGMNPERRLEMMQKQLSLTADQTAQVKGIFDEGKGKMEELHANTALSPEDKRAKMMEIHEGQESKIKALLTPEQKTKYEAMEAKMREHGQERHPGGDGPPPPPPPQ